MSKKLKFFNLRASPVVVWSSRAAQEGFFVSYMDYGDKPKICCQGMNDAINLIAWTKKDGFNFLETDCWAMEFYGWGDAIVLVVKFCPFCGTKIESKEFLK